MAAFAGGSSLFGQGTPIPPVPDAATQLPNPAPSTFAQHHSSTELEGLGVGGGQFLHGLGLGSMYHAQGNLINELALEQRLKNRDLYLNQKRALQGGYQAASAHRLAET